MDVLCTDKTGTLTQDRIILKRHLDIQGQDSERVLQYAFLNSHFQSGLRNLLDKAVLAHVELEQTLYIGSGYSKLDEIPFDFSRRRLSVVVAREDGKHILICKGAVEEIFAVCSKYSLMREAGRLDETHLEAAKQETIDLNSDGFRVVAVAYKEMNPSKSTYSIEDESDLMLLGYIAFLDPPKETAREAIATLARKGVQVKVLTGDNEIITRKICHEVGLDRAKSCSAAKIASMSDIDLAEIADAPLSLQSYSGAKRRVVRLFTPRGMWLDFLAMASMTVLH